MSGETAVSLLMTYDFQQLSPPERMCLIALCLLEIAKEEGGGIAADPGLPYLTGLNEDELEPCLIQLERRGWIRRKRVMRVDWVNFNQP